ncbi:polysialyltransferase family glycosyltransferase [Streptomyces griseus]|uniref:polysialyltransferase family glycosyltransferase n=1 Tax=Streptomyces griseus TaxID=1911 RepID=UPI00083FDE83|nr:polysialyltransferase family glycosyltransferase [Streptomyces griseus]
MTTQIYVATSLYGTAVLAAALDAGRFPAAGRRVLLLCDTAAVPEAAPSVGALPGFEALRTRFDEVRSWNDTVSPHHPAAWTPRADDVPLWERHLRRAWHLGDDEVELVLPSPHTAPALTLAQILTGGPVTVYADGIDAYGPTGGRLPPLVGTRVRRLLLPDLVPGLRPLLLREFGVEPEPLPAEALRTVLGELADGSGPWALPSGPALLLGEGLSAAGLISPAEEEELHLRMVRETVALGHTRLLFLPPAQEPVPWSSALAAEAAGLGAELTVPDAGPSGGPALPEALYERIRPALVVGCSATALFTAATLYGLPVATSGTGMLLERLTPYENPARTAATIADALLPGLADPAAVAGRSTPTAADVSRALGGLLPAVGFAMQPRVLPGLRPAAESYLSEHLDARTWRYFKRRRLVSLALPGVVPHRLAFVRRSTTLRRLARRARAVARR